MKKLFLSFALLIFLYSCSKSVVQVYRVAKASENFKENSSQHIFENDTIRITYHFWGNRGAFDFSIYNKSTKPIYIDWKSSFFIVNSEKLNYWRDEVLTQTKTEYYKRNYNGYYTSNNPFSTVKTQSAFSYKPERITVIPPSSFYSRQSFSLLPAQAGFHKMLSDSMKKRRNAVITDSFTESNSPFLYRNFLSISFSEKTGDFFYVDNAFFVKSIVEVPKSKFRGKYLGSKDGNFLYEDPYISDTCFYIGTGL